MIRRMNEILLSAFLLAPLYGVLYKVKFRSRRKTVQYFVFAVYLAAVYTFVGLPTLQFVRFRPTFTLLPVVPMLADWKNTILNVCLFVPLGMMLPFLWADYSSLKRTAHFAFLLSLTIELLQIFTYRLTDINDLIANTLGAVAGFGVYRLVADRFPALGRRGYEKHDLPVILLSVCFVMFFIQPCLATLLYHLAG